MYWKEALSREWKPPPLQRPVPDISVSFQEAKPVTLAFLSAKDSYDNLLQQDFDINAAFNKWLKGEDGIILREEREWSDVCKRAFTASRETKLQSFQFKINNRIAPCGVHLKQIKIKPSDECPLCQQRDTLAHFFFHCGRVARFWREICRWFENTVDLRMDRISPKEFLFGVEKDYHKSKIINHILIYIRFYIYRQKLYHDGELSSIQWLQEYKVTLNREKWIYTHN